ncbi:MAG: hypothetical protein DI539_18745 [Flavobacterium psychrophilum]|nr:MAG: hypothetical protein DI539_18745 [Flavobacterium psychrophilum]
MFQLYKIRNFNAIINDTFGFFKAVGKNYFRNYFIINGPLLLILIVLGYIFFKVFFEGIFSGISGSGQVSPESAEVVESYFSDNFAMMLGLGILTGVLALIAAIISYSYPVVYLMLMEKNEKPDSKEILNALKKKIGKAIIFGLLSLVTFLPLALLLGLVSFFLIIIIIGIPVVFIFFAAFSCMIYQSFYNYISTDDGFFSSMEVGYNNLTRSFWAHAGSTAIFYLILYVVQLAIMFAGTLINMLFGLVSAGPDLENPDPQAVMQSVSIVMIVGFVIQTIVSFVMGNLIFINQGMIYYSSKEKEDNTTLYKDIDLIGRDFE